MRRALPPVLASIAVLCAMSACVPPTDVKDGDRMERHRRASRSLASGVSRADSLRVGVGRAGLVAGEGESLVLVSPARLLNPIGLCGVNAGALSRHIPPRGILLLPAFSESLFVRSQYQDPIGDAFNHIPEQPACGPVVSVFPPGNASAGAFYTSWYPYENPELVQTEPIVVRFDTAVTRVSVYGDGAFKCWTGQYGKLTAFDSAGQVVRLAPMQMREPADCAEDSITYGAYGTVAAASPTIRRLVIEAPQPPSWDVWIEGTNYGLGYVTAQYTLILSPEPGASSEPPPTVEIVSAGGPNPGGSFIVRAPENVITLRARVTPAAFADSVTWEVTGMPLHGAFNTIAPYTVPRGAVTFFVVPAENIRPGRGNFVPGDTVRPYRWPPVHPRTTLDKRAALATKSLAYVITAKITVGGQTVRSKPDTVRQDEIDTIREEYVEWGQSHVLARSDLNSNGDPLRNITGDYTVWPSGARLVEMMPVIQRLAMRMYSRRITVMSGYRNPVHHFVHAHARALNSSHLDGLATDWVISDPPPGLTDSLWFEQIHTWTKSDSVRGCWEPAQTIIETSSTIPRNRRLNHGHTDWRADCRGW